MFGVARAELNREWRILHNVELHVMQITCYCWGSEMKEVMTCLTCGYDG
jgi:hypothetical protein